ncbi:hypothetical protein EGM70_20975 [Enterobacteriaceae bacterium 89]|nr:hypothetical protein [Enterobacteriaceae bacterium 89]
MKLLSIFTTTILMLLAFPLEQSVGQSDNQAGQRSPVSVQERENSSLMLSPLQRDWLKYHTQINVILDARRAPFAFINQYGEPDGLAVAILTLFSQRYGLKFRYLIAHNDDELRKLKAQHPAAIMSDTLTIPHEQAAEYPQPPLSLPWLTSPVVLLMLRGNGRPANLHELTGERIAVLGRSTLLPWLDTWLPTLQIEQAGDLRQAIGWLKAGKVRGIIISQFAAEYALLHKGENRLCSALPLPVPPLIASFSAASNSSVALTILNQALQKTPPQQLLVLTNHWLTPLSSPLPHQHRSTTWRLILLGLSTLLMMAGVMVLSCRSAFL